MENKEILTTNDIINDKVKSAFCMLEEAMKECTSAAELSILFIEYQNALQESFFKVASNLHEKKITMENEADYIFTDLEMD